MFIFPPSELLVVSCQTSSGNRQPTTRNRQPAFSDFDIDYLPDYQETYEYKHAATDRHDNPGEVPHGVHIGGVDERNDHADEGWEGRNNVARHAALCRQDLDFALDTYALANGVRYGVEDLSEVATDFVLDIDSRDEEIEVFGGH